MLFVYLVPVHLFLYLVPYLRQFSTVECIFSENARNSTKLALYMVQIQHYKNKHCCGNFTFFVANNLIRCKFNAHFGWERLYLILHMLYLNLELLI